VAEMSRTSNYVFLSMRLVEGE